MEKVKFTFYIPKELADKLNKLIALHMLKKGEKITKSSIVEKALEKEIERMEKELGET